MNDRNTKLKNRLVRTEGWRNKPYTDTVKKVSIGVGFNLTDVGLLDEEITFILDNRVRIAREQAEHIPVYADLNDDRQDVLVDMVYNMGLDQVLRFKKTLKYLAMKEWELAADEMLDSHWADQVGKRAIELANVIRTGVAK